MIEAKEQVFQLVAVVSAIPWPPLQTNLTMSFLQRVKVFPLTLRPAPATVILGTPFQTTVAVIGAERNLWSFVITIVYC